MTIKETILWPTFTLPDVGEVLIREAGPEDAEGLRRMFSRCSQETIYLRFHLALTSVSEQLIALLLGGTEGGGRRALVAVSGDGIFGHAMYARDEGSDREAKFAIVVEDGRQERGLGTLLLSEIAEEARRDGVEALTGVTLANNRRILDLTRRVLPGRLCSFRSGTCVIHAPLAFLSIERRPEGEESPYPSGTEGYASTNRRQHALIRLRAADARGRERMEGTSRQSSRGRATTQQLS